MRINTLNSIFINLNLRMRPYEREIGCTTSFDWASEKLSLVWVRLFSENLRIVASKDRTNAESDHSQLWFTYIELNAG